jgi:hypothetical protein
MMPITKIAIIAGSAVMLLMAGCASNETGDSGWRIPKEGLVRDRVAAKTIARAVWFSIHPDWKQSSDTEEEWQSSMDATLRNGVWEVASKMKPGEIGGSLVILIAQSDGHVVDIYLTQ